MTQRPLEPLVNAVKVFQDALDPTQETELLAIHGASAPDAKAVFAFTAQVEATGE